jgi:hypothetical protein
MQHWVYLDIQLSCYNDRLKETERVPMIILKCRKPWKFVLTNGSSYSKLLLGLIYSCSWLVVWSSFHVHFCRLYVCCLLAISLDRCLSAFRSWILGSPAWWVVLVHLLAARFSCCVSSASYRWHHARCKMIGIGLDRWTSPSAVVPYVVHALQASPSKLNQPVQLFEVKQF